MGLFDRLFKTPPGKSPFPNIKLGRYSDSYKKPANYEAWDQSLHYFESENFLDAYRKFLIYLRDEEENNVHFQEEEGLIRFEIFQGSKKIEGFATKEKLKAEAKIARSAQLNVGFMRRLIEKNFTLKYSRFALDPGNNLTILFDTYTLDGSPYKLYYALKEVATNADKLDDLLVEEFKMLQQINSARITDIPQTEKAVKYQFTLQEIQRIEAEMSSGKLSKEQYPGGFAYLLLHLIYKLDFLVHPEGYMMETLERLHRQYFSNDGKTTVEKNQAMVRELQKLAARPKEEFCKELYLVTFTFGITTPVNHDRIASFIDSELHNMDWYLENGHEQVALAVPGYIIGYCLFNYAPPKPDRDLFHLFFLITESRFFHDLGQPHDLVDPQTGALNKKAIKRAIQRIVEDNKPKYPKLHAATGMLSYQSLPAFAKSFLLMIRNMDMTKID